MSEREERLPRIGTDREVALSNYIHANKHIATHEIPEGDAHNWKRHAIGKEETYSVD